jgi:SpoVK/Ycf46/Vps4 family AAA+-type ATPase
VASIAHAIGWDFLPVNPTTFLSKGLGNIYVQAKELFEDLRDLYRTVVFFDEMDAMLQRRVDDSGKPQLTVEQQFLTTSMLPQLANLYDDNRLLFFVATNYGKTFDAAIVRPGRFDMLLFMGPPTWRAKRDHLMVLTTLQDETSSPDIQWRLGEWVHDDEPLGESLSLATVGEIRAMMNSLCMGEALDIAIGNGTITKDAFRQRAEMWKDERFTLCKDKDNELRSQYFKEKDTSEIR